MHVLRNLTASNIYNIFKYILYTVIVFVKFEQVKGSRPLKESHYYGKNSEWEG